MSRSKVGRGGETGARRLTLSPSQPDTREFTADEWVRHVGELDRVAPEAIRRARTEAAGVAHETLNDADSTRAALLDAAFIAHRRHRLGRPDPALVELRAALDRYLATRTEDEREGSRRLPPLSGARGGRARADAIRSLRDDLPVVRASARRGSSDAAAMIAASALALRVSWRGLAPRRATEDALAIRELAEALMLGATDDVVLVHALVAAGIARKTARNWVDGARI